MIGKSLVLNDESYLVVGVLPADLRFLNADASFWAPAAVTPTLLAYRDMRSVRVIARLKPDVTREQAQAETAARMQQIARDVPDEADDLGAIVQPLHDYLTGDVRRPLLVLLAGVAFVLLIGCANLANLLLSRAVSRRKEIAVRVALGVGRWRIARQLITESVLLSVMGGACGLLVAAWSLAVLRQFIPPALTSSASVGLDGPVLAYTLGLVGAHRCAVRPGASLAGHAAGCARGPETERRAGGLQPSPSSERVRRRRSRDGAGPVDRRGTVDSDLLSPAADRSRLPRGAHAHAADTAAAAPLHAITRDARCSSSRRSNVCA